MVLGKAEKFEEKFSAACAYFAFDYFTQLLG